MTVWMVSLPVHCAQPGSPCGATPWTPPVPRAPLSPRHSPVPASWSPVCSTETSGSPAKAFKERVLPAILRCGESQHPLRKGRGVQRWSPDARNISIGRPKKPKTLFFVGWIEWMCSWIYIYIHIYIYIRPWIVKRVGFTWPNQDQDGWLELKSSFCAAGPPGVPAKLTDNMTLHAQKWL